VCVHARSIAPIGGKSIKATGFGRSLNEALPVRTFLCDLAQGQRMNREDLIRALRRYCRKRGMAFALDTKRGKGAHYLVVVGDRRTTLQSNMSAHIVRLALKQLNVRPEDL
jgi:hypothetical protein